MESVRFSTGVAAASSDDTFCCKAKSLVVRSASRAACRLATSSSISASKATTMAAFLARSASIAACCFATSASICASKAAASALRCDSLANTSASKALSNGLDCSEFPCKPLPKDVDGVMFGTAFSASEEQALASIWFAMISASIGDADATSVAVTLPSACVATYTADGVAPAVLLHTLLSLG